MLPCAADALFSLLPEVGSTHAPAGELSGDDRRCHAGDRPGDGMPRAHATGTAAQRAKVEHGDRVQRLSSVWAELALQLHRHVEFDLERASDELKLAPSVVADALEDLIQLDVASWSDLDGYVLKRGTE